MFSNLPVRNNTDFSYAAAAAVAALRTEPGETSLQFHQRVPVQYLVESDARGLYLYHHMGSGKSRTAVAVCEALSAALPDWHFLFISTKSLHSNFAAEAKLYYRDAGYPEATWATRLAKYKFVSSNASNMLVQLRRTLSSSIDLERTVVVIDEAHELCNAIANGSSNAIGLYSAIMATRELKLVMMSGTPITGDPYEFALAMNMVAGRDKHGHALFGESYDAFCEAFINRPEVLDLDVAAPDGTTSAPDRGAAANKTPAVSKRGAEERTAPVDMLRIRNREKFIARIVGLVSCYNPRDDVESGAHDAFPEQLPQMVLRIPMGSAQYAAYSVARDHELEEARKRIFSRAPANPLARSSGGAQSTYRVASRQLGDFAFPSHAAMLERTAGRLRYVRHPEKLTAADLSVDLAKYSQKICVAVAILLHYAPKSAGKIGTVLAGVAAAGHRILREMDVILPEDRARGLANVYSQFSESCIAVIAQVLETCGCVRVRPEQPKHVPVEQKVKVGETVDEDNDIISDAADAADAASAVSVNSAGKVGGAAKPKKTAAERAAKPPKAERAEPDSEPSGPFRFGVIDGSIEIWERDAIRAAYRDRSNVAGAGAVDYAGGTRGKLGSGRGSSMAWLLFSAVGATGTNTEGVTCSISMESYWKPSRSAQVDTRAVRYRSHTMLPPELRRVQTFMLLSDYPTEAVAAFGKVGPPEPTTDVQLHLKSSALAAVNEVFLLAIAAASLDCSMWSAAALARSGMACHMCAPTNQILFLDDLRDEIRDTTVRCQAPQTADVRAQILEHDGKKYAAYLDAGSLALVEWNVALRGYTPIGVAHPHWDVLAAKGRKVLRIR